jgi:hypothetical protein
MASLKNPTNLNTHVSSPEELRDFFNNGGIKELAEPLDDLLERDEFKEQQEFRLTDEKDHGEFAVYWQDQGSYRLLVVQSNLARLAGLYLNVPVKHEAYEVAAGGQMGASHSPKLESGHRVGHYLKKGQAFAIGDPMVAVKVHQIAKWELLEACGVSVVSEVGIS